MEGKRVARIYCNNFFSADKKRENVVYWGEITV